MGTIFSKKRYLTANLFNFTNSSNALILASLIAVPAISFAAPFNAKNEVTKLKTADKIINQKITSHDKQLSLVNQRASDAISQAVSAQKIGVTLIQGLGVKVNSDGSLSSLDTTTLKGVKGDTGAVGAKGDTGPQGLKGETGATGAQGLKGDKGDTGATGAQGVKGDKGAQGLKGDVGATGARGPIGLTGAQGPQGPQGPAGGIKTVSFAGRLPQQSFNNVNVSYDSPIFEKNTLVYLTVNIKASAYNNGVEIFICGNAINCENSVMQSIGKVSQDEAAANSPATQLVSITIPAGSRFGLRKVPRSIAVGGSPVYAAQLTVVDAAYFSLE